MIRRFLTEYLARNDEALDAPEALFTAKYPYSMHAFEVVDNATRVLVEETKKFCAEQGYRLDRISIVSVHDGDLNLKAEEGASSHEDVILRVVRRPDGKTEAIVFTGGYVERKD